MHHWHCLCSIHLQNTSQDVHYEVEDAKGKSCEGRSKTICFYISKFKVADIYLSKAKKVKSSQKLKTQSNKVVTFSFGLYFLEVQAIIQRSKAAIFMLKTSPKLTSTHTQQLYRQT